MKSVSKWVWCDREFVFSVERIVRLSVLTVMNKSFKNNLEELKRIPRTSGIYYYYDENNVIIYIGKADSLYKRNLAHFKNHSIDRQMGFFVKMIESKGFSIHEEEKLPKELSDIWYNLKQGDFSSNPIVIDWVFDKVKRIEIEEIDDKELRESKEKEMIKKFQPIYNSESYSDEYYKLKYG